MFVGALLALYLKNRVPGLGLLAGLRAVVCVTQCDAALEYHGLRRCELRARVDELRANLAESAADSGVAAAMHRLGPPRVLAAEVAGSRMVPSWSRGAIWAGVAGAIGLLGLGMSLSAFLTAVEAAVEAGTTATWSALFVTMTATSVENGPPDFTLDLPFATLALLLVPFAVGSRVWRSGDKPRPRDSAGPVHGQGDNDLSRKSQRVARQAGCVTNRSP